MARKGLTRLPLIPLDYVDRDKSMPREFIVDYDNKKLYAKNRDGSGLIGFNKYSDDHIANGDLHVTKEFKDSLSGNLDSIDSSITSIMEILGKKANIASPALTGVPTAPTAGATINTTQIATTAFVQAAIKVGNADMVDGKHVDDTKDTNAYLWTAFKTKQYVDSLLASNDAMIFKGTIGNGGTITTLPAQYDAGWTYRVITAGTYAGHKCEVADLLICIKDYVSTFNNADWTAVQTNIDGAVTSVATSSVNNHVPIFDGATGKIIKSSGKGLPTGTIIGDTDYGTIAKGGTVKSSTGTNKNTIETDGTITTNLVGVDKGGTGKTSVALFSMLYASATNSYAEVPTGAFGRSLLNAEKNKVFAGLNADMIDGMHVTNTAVGDVWGFIPKVASDGVMDIGRYLDFHSTSNDGDYTYRFNNTKERELTGSGNLVLPQVKVLDLVNLNDKAYIKHNSNNDTIEFVFN